MQIKKIYKNQRLTLEPSNNKCEPCARTSTCSIQKKVGKVFRSKEEGIAASKTINLRARYNRSFSSLILNKNLVILTIAFRSHSFNVPFKMTTNRFLRIFLQIILIITCDKIFKFSLSKQLFNYGCGTTS